MVLELNKDSFENEVIKSKTPVIVDFWAEWCGPCKMMGPVFEEVSKEYAGKLEFAKVNVDEQGELAEKNNVMGIPCLIIFNKGKEVDRIVGFNPKDMFKIKVNEILAKIK